MVSPFEGELTSGEQINPPSLLEDGMIDRLMEALIGTLADGIAGTAVAVAEDAQARRETLARYKSEAQSHAARLLSQVTTQGHAALRNRYAGWLQHPRLGHESLTAELRAAEIGIGEAVMALTANPSLRAEALTIAASLRLVAVSDVLGDASIYREGAALRAPLPPRAAKRPLRSDDRRLGRRTMRIDDVPPSLYALVARLGADDPARDAALDTLAAARAGPEDATGMVTRLVTLAMRAENQTQVEALAAAAAAAMTTDTAVAPDGVASAEIDAIGDADDTAADAAIGIVVTSGVDDNPEVDIAPEATAEGVASVPATVPEPTIEVLQQIGDTADPVALETIRRVVDFVNDNRWAIILGRDRITLKPLRKRHDINVAFDRVADLPAMQTELRRIHASPQQPRT